IKLVRLSVYIGCAVGFIEQTLSLSQKYLRYGTVVHLDIENTVIIELPSVTVCLPGTYTKAFIAEKYPEAFPSEDANSEKYTSRSQYDQFNMIALKRIYSSTLEQVMSESITDDGIVKC